MRRSIIESSIHIMTCSRIVNSVNLGVVVSECAVSQYKGEGNRKGGHHFHDNLPSSEERESSRNCKGGITQNILACCSFDLRFQYFLSGADGTSSNATLFIDARTSDLRVPLGRYYLANAGFAACDSLIIPYRQVHYHLAEWGRADLR
jgi:hypothetical protein